LVLLQEFITMHGHMNVTSKNLTFPLKNKPSWVFRCITSEGKKDWFQQTELNSSVRSKNLYLILERNPSHSNDQQKRTVFRYKVSRSVFHRRGLCGTRSNHGNGPFRADESISRVRRTLNASGRNWVRKSYPSSITD